MRSDLGNPGQKHQSIRTTYRVPGGWDWVARRAAQRNLVYQNTQMTDALPGVGDLMRDAKQKARLAAGSSRARSVVGANRTRTTVPTPRNQALLAASSRHGEPGPSTGRERPQPGVRRSATLRSPLQSGTGYFVARYAGRSWEPSFIVIRPGHSAQGRPILGRVPIRRPLPERRVAGSGWGYFWGYMGH